MNNISNNLQYRKSVRIYKRRSTPLESGASQTLQKTFEETSFQSIYQKISKQMKVDMLHNRKKSSEFHPRVDQLQKRNQTKEFSGNKERKLFYSVERTRKYRYNGIAPAQNLLAKLSQNRSTTPAARSMQKIKQMSDLSTNLLKKPQQPLLQFVAMSNQLNSEFGHLKQMLAHFRLLENVQAKLKQAQIGQSLIDSVREYILEGQGSDVSQMHTLFTSEKNKVAAKAFILLQRVSVLIMIEQLVRKKLKFEYSHVKALLSLVVDTYIQILSIIDKIQPEFVKGKQQLNTLRQLQLKKPTGLMQFFRHSESIQRRLTNILRYSRDFLSFTQSLLKNSTQLTTNMCFYKLLEFFALHLIELQMGGPPDFSLSFLSTCPSPYLHNQPSKPYTLVLDLDQTLVHYNNKNQLGQLKIRPYCQQFIFQMCQFYEVGIFTCAMPDYADWVTNHFSGLQFKLYRHHTIQTTTGFVKDLSRLGRDIRKIVIVDNLSQNFQLHRQNGIQIKTWFDDPNDTALVDVMKVLKSIVKHQPQDIRVALREYGEALLSQKRPIQQ